MIRYRTHHFGDDCPGGHRTTRRPDPRVTDDDVHSAVGAHTIVAMIGGSELDSMRAALETAFEPGGLVARAVAAELDRVANDAFLDDPGVLGILLHLAQEWREGSR